MRDWDSGDDGEGLRCGRDRRAVISLLVQDSSSSLRSTTDREAEEIVELDGVVRLDGRLGPASGSVEVGDSRIGRSSPGERERGVAGGEEAMEVATEIFLECG